jgi:aromatic ring-opening dioxygenase catalytic subunit (LigB family)
MPVVYLPHGGGPWPFIQQKLGDPVELDKLAAYLRSVPSLPKTPPKAILVVSAHWEEKVPTVSTAESPPLLFDYYGFPPEAYTLTWPAPGDPAVAARVRELLQGAGFATGADPKRGFDHATFVPLKLAYPDADVPTVQLSLKAGLDPAEHLAIGRALAPLRDEGVFIIGSGSSYHNMAGFFGRAGDPGPPSRAFDAWLEQAATAPAGDRDAMLERWASAPSARASHPREEHLIPLHVVAGAAGADRGRLAYRGALMGAAFSGYDFGSA